jgi:DNA oxidative demethylase
MFKGHVLLIKNYLKPSSRSEALKEILRYKPIWEYRYSDHNPPPAGEKNRILLRPVYWLGNWQFACLNYYHPPKGTEFRCVKAESYPPLLQKIVNDIEARVKDNWRENDIPKGWHLNTCLINYYGSKIEEGKKIDAARVGEHKDFEPGPVASLSFGEKALFQFVKSAGKQSKSQVILQQWLEDNSLQIFGGDRYKKQLFHRVQRVERGENPALPDIKIENFQTRRINLTFRYVPTEHVLPLDRFPQKLKSDVKNYVTELGTHSSFWKALYK